MNYNFIKFKSRFIKGENCLHINSSNLNISKEAYRHLGKPEKIDIFYDVENKVLKIIEGNTRKVSKSRTIGTTKLSQIMPKGKYTWLEGYLWKLQE